MDGTLMIRRAVPGDAAALAAFAESAFRATFGAQNSAENMDVYCAGAYGESIQAREISDPGIETLVAMQDDRPIGYAQLRWGAAPGRVTAVKPAEISRLYVDHAQHGKGVARELMDRLFALAGAGGADLIWLGVWEHNPRAIAFYRKHGFTPVGDHIFKLGDDPQRDLIFVRPLGDRGGAA
jgi:ribosomal protein S18 acetylase RimI-like enzyme